MCILFLKKIPFFFFYRRFWKDLWHTNQYKKEGGLILKKITF